MKQRHPPTAGIRSRASGFSLVEILAAVAILTMLVALAFPALKGIQDKTSAVRCVSNLHTLHTGWVQYYTENNGVLLTSYNNGVIWDNALFRYIPNLNPQHRPEIHTVYQCPSNPYRNGYWSSSNYAY